MKFALSLLLPSLIYADVNLQQWQSRRPIKVDALSSTVEFVIDADVYRHSTAGLRDMRIVRDGVETPYQLRLLSGSKDEQQRSLAILDKTFVPGQGLRAVLDLGANAASHNRLQVATSKQNFREAVIVETSDDRKAWAVARNDALIFDISREHRHVDDLTIEYPASTARYVRLTVGGWRDVSDLESARLTYVTETLPTRDVVVSSTPSTAQNANEKTTSFQLDTGVQGQPYDQLDLTISQELFFRNVEVLTSNDAQQWTYAGSGVIRRTVDANDHLISLREQSNRFIKLVVTNGDDPPLSINRIAVSGIRRVVRFLATQPGAYWLYVGNNVADSPHYDYAMVTSATAQAPLVSLGKSESNPGFQAPKRPLLDRNPVLLNALLVLAVLTMGFVTVRFLRKVKVP